MKKIVIVGRPNVGKSTLFNRLFGRKRALVHDEPGVTRDRLEEKVSWWQNAKKYDLTVVDTGGLGGERFTQEIEEQVQLALDEADIVLFLFDSQAGLTPMDWEIIRKLKQGGVKAPILGVINKIDDEVKHEHLMHEFYQCPLDRFQGISAEHGIGMDALKDAIIEMLGIEGITSEQEKQQNELNQADLAQERLDNGQENLQEEVLFEKRIPRLAIIGKPNAGKSTLVNALLGESRMITSTIAGTTVDAIDSLTEMGGKPYILIDTAGIRRKSKTEQGVEVLSVVQARKALERCDVALLVINGEDGVTDQDEKIGGLIEETGCSVLLIVNKWDLLNGKQKGLTQESAAEIVRSKMPFLRYAPLLFVSALYKKGLGDLPEIIDDVLEQKRLKVSTKEFTEWVRKESTIHNPKNAKFYMSHQSGRNPPTFVCHVSDPEKIHFSLKRHLVNAMRSRWGYVGSPVRLLFVKGGGLKSNNP